MPKPSISEQDSSFEDSKPAETDTISDDGSQTISEHSSSSSSSNMTANETPKPKRVSLVKTIVAILGAIIIGFSAGKEYAAARAIGQQAEVEASQCSDADADADASSPSIPVDTSIAFRFVTVENDEEDDDEDDEDDDDDEDDEDDDEEGVGKLMNLFLNAYGVEDHFEDYNGTNGQEIITEFLQDMLEASDECEGIFPLLGHLAYDSVQVGGSNSQTLEVIGMLRDGKGHVSVSAWPAEERFMANFFLKEPSKAKEKETDEIIYRCANSIAMFLYPDDVIEPNGLEGTYGNVPHLSQMGPFEVMSKYGKDPFRFRWWTDPTRGMFDEASADEMNNADLLDQLGSSDDWTNRVTSVQSPFQQIDIVDSEDDFATIPLLEYFTNPDLVEIREYMESHPKLFEPDRMLYLDGVIQSTKEGLAPYHEALVHPAMFTHPHPKRVGIVGGGECATLREALKHNTVETVVMVEIDPVIVNVSKHFLPEWNDCSMFEGSSRYCMDDPRVEMYHLDALQWFRDRFSDEAKHEGHELYGTEEKFDVVILDALDPQNAVDFVEALYGDGAFLNSLYNSLTDDGVLLTQVGEAVGMGDIAETYPGNYNYQRSMYEKGLKNQGFTVVMNYEEPRAGFGGIWSFFAAFKHDSSRARWLMNEAQLDLEIQKRAVRRVDEDQIESGEVKGLFDYFDGPTMSTYQYPSKGAQVTYCLRDPKPYGCTTDIKDHYAQQRAIYEPQGFDPEIPNVGAENFEVSNQSELVSRLEVPKNSYLMLEQSIHSVQISPLTSAILQSEESIYDTTIGPVINFVSGDREGLTIPRRGDIHSTYRVDSGLLSFLGHGCDGSFNTESGVPSSVTEASADPDVIPEDGLLGRSYSNTVVRDLIFNPSNTRNSHLPEFVVSSRTIPKGDSITSNYVPWYNDAGWKGHVESLRAKCSSSAE